MNAVWTVWRVGGLWILFTTGFYIHGGQLNGNVHKIHFENDPCFSYNYLNRCPSAIEKGILHKTH